MKIYPELSEKVLKRIAGHYGMEIHETAEGIVKIAVMSMAGAIHTMTVRRGIDPREFSMVSFGGAGPLHSALIARELRIPRVIISTMPGNFSAWGMLMTDLRRDYVQTYVKTFEEIEAEDITQLFEKMETEASGTLKDERFPSDRVKLIRGLDIRYLGQGHALTVAVPTGRFTEDDKIRAADSFDNMHLARYLHNAPTELKQIIALRLTAVGMMKKATLPTIKRGSENPPDFARKPTREVYLNGSFRKSKIYDRPRLLSHNVIYGPAVIEETVSTTLLLDGQVLRVDDYGHLVITEAN
jgi:N-methylhydantoinase A